MKAPDRPELPNQPMRRTPRWFFVLIGGVGLVAGGLYAMTAFTQGPLARNLIIALVWGGMGLLWILAGVLLPGGRHRDP